MVVVFRAVISKSGLVHSGPNLIALISVTIFSYRFLWNRGWWGGRQLLGRVDISLQLSKPSSILRPSNCTLPEHNKMSIRPLDLV